MTMAVTMIIVEPEMRREREARLRMDPADTNGGTGGGAHPEWTKAQMLLLMFWNKLQEAFDNGESELQLVVARGGDQTGVYIGVGEQQKNVSDEIPELRRGGEAVSVFDRLWQERYLHASWGRDTPYNTIGTPLVTGLSTKGLVDIGKFPDPDQRLAAALEHVQRTIEEAAFLQGLSNG